MLFGPSTNIIGARIYESKLTDRSSAVLDYVFLPNAAFARTSHQERLRQVANLIVQETMHMILIHPLKFLVHHENRFQVIVRDEEDGIDAVAGCLQIHNMSAVDRNGIQGDTVIMRIQWHPPLHSFPHRIKLKEFCNSKGLKLKYIFMKDRESCDSVQKLWQVGRIFLYVIHDEDCCLYFFSVAEIEEGRQDGVHS